MSEGGEQYAEEGEKLNQQQRAAAAAQAAGWSQPPPQQQGGRPRWMEAAVNGEGQGKKGDGDGREGVRQGMPVSHEAEDDSGLELCLGLSLGGGSKGRSREVKMPTSSDSGGEKLKDNAGSKPGLNNFELSSKNLGRKEFGEGGDVKFEGPMRGAALPGFDAWRPPAGEEEAKLAMQHMAAMHAMQAGKAMQVEQQQQQNGGPKEEVPFYQDLQQGLAQNAAAAAMAFSNAMVWARYAQVAANGVPPVQLMEPLGKDGGGGGAHGGPDAAGRMVLQPSGPSGSFPQGLHFEQGMHPGQQQQTLQRQASGMSAADLALQDANLDPQVRQRLEQQRKNQAQAQRRQEARKKRKFQQEQKLQKKAKKEDEPRMAAPPVGKPRAGTPPAGSLKTVSSLPSNCKEVSSPPDSQEGASGGSVGSGFRRMGSGSWPRGSLGLFPEKSENGPSSVGDQETAGEQMQEIKRGLQNLAKDRERASKEKDRDSGTGSVQPPSEDRKVAEQSHLQRLKAEDTAWPQGPEGNHDVARQQPTPTNVLDMARLGQEGWFQKLMEAQMVNPGLQQAAIAALMHEHAAAAPSSGDHSQRRREPLERTTSAIDHDRLKSSPENSVDRKSSPLRYEGRSGDRPAAGKVNLPTPPFPGNVPMAGMPGVPPGFPPANFMHMPYPFPIPIPNAAAFPFPFPYLLQPGPAPGGPDAQHNGPRPVHGPNGSPFQLLVTPPGYAPYLPNPEMGTPWPHVVRPQAATLAAVSPPKSIARTASGMSEDEVARNQGSKTGEKNRSRSRSTSPTEEHTAGVRGIPAPPSATSKQTGGAFASMRNGSVPNFSPQFNLPRAMSETGERMLPREGSVGSAFASLTMSSEPAESGEPKPQVKGPVENGLKHERSRDAASGPEESGASAVTQPGACGDASNSDPDRTGAAGAGAGMTPQGTDGKTSNPLTAQASNASSSLAQTSGAANASEKVTRESRIAPGVAAGEVFGGTGNIPQLPWVQCTGAGPNGKTICGALYSCQKVIKIVCKCHGNHMTPAEFVAHAGGVDVANPEKAITVSHFSLPNQAAIAHG